MDLNNEIKNISFGKTGLYTKEGKIGELSSSSSYQIGNILIVKEIEYKIVNIYYRINYSSMSRCLKEDGAIIFLEKYSL